AARVLGGQAQDYRLEPGQVVGPTGAVSLGTLLQKFQGVDSGEFVGIGRITPETHDGDFAKAPLFWETAAGGCEIELDEGTGAIRVRRLVSAADVGVVLNRKAAEGQDEGAAVQGLGHTLSEEYAYEDGQLINGTMFDYHV